MISTIDIPANTAFMRLIDEEMLSKATSIVSILSQGLVPIASVMAGIVLQNLGSLSLLIICSAGFTAASVFLLLNKKVQTI